MSDYFTRLAERALGLAPLVRPAIPPVFAEGLPMAASEARSALAPAEEEADVPSVFGPVPVRGARVSAGSPRAWSASDAATAAPPVARDEVPSRGKAPSQPPGLEARPGDEPVRRLMPERGTSRSSSTSEGAPAAGSPAASVAAEGARGLRPTPSTPGPPPRSETQQAASKATGSAPAQAPSRRESASVESATSPAGAPERATPERATPERATPERATPERATPERATPERATPERATPERATPERATPERATPERATPERATPERAVPKAAGHLRPLAADGSRGAGVAHAAGRELEGQLAAPARPPQGEEPQHDEPSAGGDSRAVRADGRPGQGPAASEAAAARAFERAALQDARTMARALVPALLPRRRAAGAADGPGARDVVVEIDHIDVRVEAAAPLVAAGPEPGPALTLDGYIERRRRS